MQSRRQSITETCSNTLIGMIGSWLITWQVFATIDDKAFATTLTVALCTAWSLVRGYFVRRHFNKQESSG